MFQSDLFPASEKLSSVPLAYAVGTRIGELLTSGRHLTARASSLATGQERARDDRSQRSSWTAGSLANAAMSGSPRTRRCLKMHAATGKRLAGCRSISSRSHAGNSATL